MSTGGVDSGTRGGLPVDPDVVIPKAVKAAAARSAEIHGQAYKAQGDQPPPPPADQQAQPQQAQPQPQPQPQSQPQSQPQQVDSIGLPVTPPPAEGSWEQRARSAEGRLGSQAREISSLRAANQNLESRLAALERGQRQQPQPQPQPQPAPREFPKAVTAAEETEYGKDFLDVVGRKAVEATAPIIDEAVKKALAPIQSQAAQVTSQVKTAVETAQRATAQSARDQFITALTADVPNWREINRHPKFIEWLGLTDGLSGVTRKVSLENANRANDTPRCAAFFKAFLKDMGLPAPQGQAAPPANGQRPSLEALAAPGRPASQTGAPPPPPATPRIITRADIALFNTEKRQGKYTAAQLAEYETELSLAAKEGRIQT